RVRLAFSSSRSGPRCRVRASIFIMARSISARERTSMGRLSLPEYAGQLYAWPGVEPLLLEHQDAAGQDVLLLLTACWLGVRGSPADGHHWQLLQAQQAPWRQQVIEPLRQVRRALTGNHAAAALRAQVKECELAAEWHQLAQLEHYCEALEVGKVPPDAAVAAHLALCAGAVEAAERAALTQLVLAREEAVAAGLAATAGVTLPGPAQPPPR